MADEDKTPPAPATIRDADEGESDEELQTEPAGKTDLEGKPDAEPLTETEGKTDPEGKPDAEPLTETEEEAPPQDPERKKSAPEKTPTQESERKTSAPEKPPTHEAERKESAPEGAQAKESERKTSAPEGAPAKESEKNKSAPEGAPAKESERKTSAPEGAPAKESEKRKSAPEGAPAKESERKTSAPEGAPAKESEKKKSAPGEKVAEKDKGKKESIQPLFDSKGSLLETESSGKQKLEELKAQKAAVAGFIKELQAKVQEYKNNPNPTDNDIKQMKKLHAAFLDEMSKYEEITRNVVRLMGMDDIPTSQLDMNMSGPQISKPQPEPVQPPTEPKPKPRTESTDDSLEWLTDVMNKLPKVIVCGTDMSDRVPKIIVCEPLRKKDTEPFYHPADPREVPATPNDPGMMKKLGESFETQQKLAKENAEMAAMRHQLQEELFCKQEVIENMKQRMMAIESENYKIQQENADLQQCLEKAKRGQGSEQGGYPMCKRELYMKCWGGEEGTQENYQAVVCRCKAKRR